MTTAPLIDWCFVRHKGLTRRIAITGAVAALAAWMSWTAHPTVYGGVRSDFSMLHAAASAWLAGTDPYSAVGPGRAYDVGHGVLYPMTAVMVSAPFTVVPWPDPAFAACGAALLAWALTGHSRFRFAWFLLLTPAFIYTVRMTQWSALVTGAALLPAWGFLLAAKPTVGAALWLAYPSRRAAVGAIAFLAASLVLLPTWPASWLAATAGVTHIRPPLFYWGGPLILLALGRWRRPEARLLAALACVPHTPELYESLYLFLVPSSLAQGALLAALNYGIVFARRAVPPPADYAGDMAANGQWMVLLLYLPCVAMVLLRPNVAVETAIKPSAGNATVSTSSA
jgi:hypothetical protein